MGSSSPVSISPPTEDSADVWLLKRRHEDLGTMFRAVWEYYINFYTVFLTFSVAAMGWLLTRNANDRVPKNIDHVLAIVFIAQSLLTAITSGFVAIYSRRVGREHRRVENDVLGTVPAPPALVGTKGIPVELGMWSGWANAAAMLGMSYAWAYIAFHAK